MLHSDRSHETVTEKLASKKFLTFLLPKYRVKQNTLLMGAVTQAGHARTSKQKGALKAPSETNRCLDQVLWSCSRYAHDAQLYYLQFECRQMA